MWPFQTHCAIAVSLSSLPTQVPKIRCFRGKRPAKLPYIKKFSLFLLHCNKNAL